MTDFRVSNYGYWVDLDGDSVMATTICFVSQRRVNSGIVVTVSLTTNALHNPPNTLEIFISDEELKQNGQSINNPNYIYKLAEEKFFNFASELAHATQGMKVCV